MIYYIFKLDESAAKFIHGFITVNKTLTELILNIDAIKLIDIDFNFIAVKR